MPEAGSVSILRRIKGRVSAFMHTKQLEKLRRAEHVPPPSKELYHLVIIPVIKEGRNVVEPGISGIAEGQWPASRILVAIAVEASAAPEIKNDMAYIRETYKDKFLDIVISEHPNDIRGEARVKGANTTYAAKNAKRIFDEKHIPYGNVIVSCFDSDTVPSPDYFSCLTYYYMVTPDRARSSFQPIPVYYNNIWEVPSFARIMDIGTSFFELIEATNPQKLVTFSSHSMSFAALVDVGYWPVDMISDDSAIFWKAFIHYEGNYHVVPIYTTVSMDIVTGETLPKTFINIYKQKRRWAWGVENFPIVMRAFLESRRISLYRKITYGFKLLDSFISWATWSFLLTFISWIPAVFAGVQFSSSTFYYLAPRIRGSIFSLASVGIIVCMLISFLLLPKQGKVYKPFRMILHVLEWLAIPFIVLALSAIPALDAQTRFMLGKHMEFWVADKHRGK